MPEPESEVSLTVRAVFDPKEEAVGVDAVASQAFESGQDTRAMIETLAAITAKANCIAAEVIQHWDAPDQKKAELYEHFAALKENMLNDMLQRIEGGNPRSQ